MAIQEKTGNAVFSDTEKEKISAVVAFVKTYLDVHGKLPTQRLTQSHIGCATALVTEGFRAFHAVAATQQAAEIRKGAAEIFKEDFDAQVKKILTDAIESSMLKIFEISSAAVSRAQAQLDQAWAEKAATSEMTRVLLNERLDEAQENRDKAVADMKAAVKEAALAEAVASQAKKERDDAIRERDDAIRERDELKSYCDTLKDINSHLQSSLESLQHPTNALNQAAVEQTSEAAEPKPAQTDK